MGFTRGFKAEANRIAVRVRANMGLSPTDPINPEKICEHYDIRLLKLSEIDPDSPFLDDDKSSEFSAVTVPVGLHTSIVHNDSHHPNRQRSNICHELAHCFLGHKCTPPLTEKGERARDGGLEAEANFLGGALLIPDEAAKYIVRNGLTLKAESLYGVSPGMLKWRLQVSGANVIHQRWVKKQRAG